MSIDDYFKVANICSSLRKRCELLEFELKTVLEFQTNKLLENTTSKSKSKITAEITKKEKLVNEYIDNLILKRLDTH